MLSRIGGAVKNGMKNAVIGSKNKFVNFVTQVATDYKSATTDLIEVFTKKPYKSSSYVAFGSSMVYLYWTKPTEIDFRQNYINFHHDLALG